MKPKRKPSIAAMFGGESELAFWSFRYFLGRMTIQTCHFAEQLAKVWTQIDERHRCLIREELEHAFVKDDEARNANSKWLPLGMDCDREAWEKVRSAYSNEHPS